MSNKEFILIPAPTSSGKSYNGATTRWRDIEAAGDKPVIHLHYTTDSRNEAVEDSKEAGIESRELLGREEACPIVDGDYDEGENKVSTPTGESASEWFQHQLNRKGDTLSHAHSYLENEVDENDGELPCSPCKSIEQWAGIPYDEDGNVSADVIHATHMFAHVPSLSNDTNLIFDERPDFTTSLGEGDNDGMTVGRFQKIITAWLEHIDAPVSDWEDFVVTSKQDGADQLTEAISEDRAVDGEWLINEKRAHALAPALTEAMHDALTSQSDRNGRRRGESTHIAHRLSKEDQNGEPRHNRSRITLIVGENNRPLVYWNVPELGNARSIICLDAWPSIYEWRQNIGTNLTYQEIVPTDKFEKWRVYERGLEVVQVGESARPASSEHAVSEYVNHTRQEIVIDKLRQEYGDDFNSIIFPNTLENKMDELLPEGFKTMTLGNVKSNNSFSDESVGLVTNSIDPGDDYVLNLLAAWELDATPETQECQKCNGEGGNDCGCDDGVRRVRGRKFTGPDSEVANEMLDGIRDYSIAQAVGRWARKSDSPRALVFVRASTVPDEMVDLTIDSEWEFNDLQQSIVDQLSEKSGMSAKDLAYDLDMTKRYVLGILNRLEKYGSVTRIQNAGDEGADLFILTGEGVENGDLDLSRL